MKCEDIVKINYSKDKDDTEIDVQTPTEYTEKKWGKKNSGEFIIDGFTFKGKHSFKKAKEGLEVLLKKGVQGEVNGIKFKVLDTKIKSLS